MDDDKKKILLIFGGVMIGLIVFISILLSLHSDQNKGLHETDSQSEYFSRTSEHQVWENGEEDEYEVDEDLLYEAEEFMGILMQAEPEQPVKTPEPDEHKGQAEREAIAAVLSIWDYKKTESVMMRRSRN